MPQTPPIPQDDPEEFSFDDVFTFDNRQHVVHQDYIVRQRYSNALPPPPGSVKQLEIPTGGLDAYTAPSFASRLARAQPINIEADAFLGMPLDLVGMPGVFDGDESSIQAPLITPAIHPRDRNLLRPLKNLGQPKTEVNSVSFLRRTQYTADDPNRRHADGTSRKLGSTQAKRRKTADVNNDGPIGMARNIMKGFDIAYPEDAYKGPDTTDRIRAAAITPAELDAWKNPVHPSKPHLKMVDAYPLLPDLDAITDEHGFMIVKFTGMPTDITDRHDPRLDAALLHPLEPSSEEIANFQAAKAASEVDPAHNLPPGNPFFDYEVYFPASERTAEAYKQKIDIMNPDKDSPALYTHSSVIGGEIDAFRFEKVREYETAHQTSNKDIAYSEIVLVLSDPSAPGADQRLAKGAYYYPIVTKMQLKPRRGNYLAQAGLAAKAEDKREKIDVAMITVRELSEDEIARRARYRAEIEGEVEEGS